MQISQGASLKMVNPNAKVNPVFKPGYNITQRVRRDDQMAHFSDYAQR